MTRGENMVRLQQSGVTLGVRTAEAEDHNDVRAAPRVSRSLHETAVADLNSPTGESGVAVDLPVNPIDDLRDAAAALERNAS